MACYHYEPLSIPTQQIRLLKFSGDSYFDSENEDEARKSSPGPTCTIEYTLTTYDILSSPRYYALSYCWGDATDIVDIKCDDRKLRVTLNLYHALRRLRRLHLEPTLEYLWVDQICINQSDLNERSQQVQLMRTIYSRSERTLIWLGLRNRADRGIFRLLDVVVRAVEDDTIEPDITAPNGASWPKTLMQMHSRHRLPGLHSSRWATLGYFLQRPWFSRAWVIQEAALSKRDPFLLFGESKYEWRYYSNVVQFLGCAGCLGFYDIEVASATFVVGQVRLYRNKTTNLPYHWTLEALLLDTQRLRESDPRDMIYAFLGLSIEGHDDQAFGDTMKADYQKDAHTIFADVARYCIKASGRLDILCTGGVDDRWLPSSDDSPPSWVPRWDLEHRKAYRKEMPHPYAPVWSKQHGDRAVRTVIDPVWYCASRETPVRLLEPSSNAELILRGVHVDSITWCSDVLSRQGPHSSYESNFNHVWEEVLCMQDFARDANTQQFQEFAKLFFVTVTDGITSHLECIRDEPLSHFWAFLAYCYANQEPPEPLLAEYQKLGQFGDRSRVPAATGIKLFMTKGGHLGLGPRMLTAHDEVFVMYGSNVLHVLRPDGKDGHYFIGEGYVDAFMDGQAIDMVEEGVLKEQWVTLR